MVVTVYLVFTAIRVPTANLDMTLASLILMNCCNLAQPIENAIRSLRQYRNDYLGHNTDFGIPETEYNVLWQDMTTFILQLDVSKKDDVIRMEKRPLDVALCTKYCTIILDNRISADEIKAKMDKYHSEATAIMEEHHSEVTAIMEKHNSEVTAKIDVSFVVHFKL